MSDKTGYSINEVMSQRPITTFENTSIKEVAQLMAKQDVNSLIVVDHENKIKGILTDEDIVRKVVLNNFDSEKVKCIDIMTKDPYVIDPESDLSEAVEIMKQLHIKHLPVARNGILLGMLTAKDIIYIEPELFEIFKTKSDVEILHINEEANCDICGKRTNKLYVIDELLLCDDCYKSIKLGNSKKNKL